jgi:hypothetical protein
MKDSQCEEKDKMVVAPGINQYSYEAKKMFGRLAKNIDPRLC